MRGVLFPWLIRLSGIVALAIGTNRLAAASQPAATATLTDPAEAAEFQIVVSVSDQCLALFRHHELMSRYSISTSKFGLGDDYGSYKTPLGSFRIREKIGGELAAGAVLKDRAATGEMVRPDTPGRDPIVSRILWLEGLEAGNRNAYDRGIYIHGTVEETRLGQPASWGCIRMRSRDVIALFHAVPIGTPVDITAAPLSFIVAEQYRQSSAWGVARPFTLGNSVPTVPANFTDITYTALLEFRLALSRFSLEFPARPPLVSSREAARLARGNLSRK